jgi:ribosome-binding factor A
MTKINELLQQELSQLIEEEGEELGMVAVVSVDSSRDLAQAHVFIASVTPTPLTQTVQKALQGRAGRYKHELGKILNLRRIPDFVFHFEENPEAFARIEAVLEELDREKNA